MNILHRFWSGREILRLLCSYFLPLALVHAQPISSVRFALIPGYGPGTPTEVGSSDRRTLQPYGLGLGARIEYIFEHGVSLGAVFVTHRGESADIISADGVPVTLTTRMRYGGFELGYLIPLAAQYAIHPRLGVGLGEPAGNLSSGRSDPGLPGSSVNGPRPYLSPGLGALVELGSQWFTGLDVRYVALADYPNANSLSVFATIGFKLSINE